MYNGIKSRKVRSWGWILMKALSIMTSACIERLNLGLASLSSKCSGATTNARGSTTSTCPTKNPFPSCSIGKCLMPPPNWCLAHTHAIHNMRLAYHICIEVGHIGSSCNSNWWSTTIWGYPPQPMPTTTWLISVIWGEMGSFGSGYLFFDEVLHLTRFSLVYTSSTFLELVVYRITVVVAQ